MKRGLYSAAIGLFAITMFASVPATAASGPASSASQTPQFTLEPAATSPSAAMVPGRKYTTLTDGAMVWTGPAGETQVIYPTPATAQRITVSPSATDAWASLGTTNSTSSSVAPLTGTCPPSGCGGPNPPVVKVSLIENGQIVQAGSGVVVSSGAVLSDYHVATIDSSCPARTTGYTLAVSYPWYNPSTYYAASSAILYPSDGLAILKGVTIPSPPSGWSTYKPTLVQQPTSSQLVSAWAGFNPANGVGSTAAFTLSGETITSYNQSQSFPGDCSSAGAVLVKASQSGGVVPGYSGGPVYDTNNNVIGLTEGGNSSTVWDWEWTPMESVLGNQGIAYSTVTGE